MDLDLRSLVSKLDDRARNSLEAASGLCVSHGHIEVELEHWFVALINEPDSGFSTFCQTFSIDTTPWLRSLEIFLEALPNGSHRPPVLSLTLIQALQKAWLLASLECQQRAIETPHVLGAILLEPRIHTQVARSCAELVNKTDATTARQWIARAPWHDPAAPRRPEHTVAGERGNDGASAALNLERFTEDLTRKAREGGMDPITGRDPEIRQLIDILIRRRQNNPILTGEAGVGKTAVVEGLALRIVRGDVPDVLLRASVHSLDLGLLQAGASVQGEFEKRLKGVIEDIEKAPYPVLLFIDEAHTLIGAGGQVGQNDAANLLKPALARGELRTIAATTWREYKKYFETDPALTRRFQIVQVDEPAEDTAINMMLALAETLRTHHGVSILDEAITASVQLSARYITGRQLPDKAVSVLDTACARVALSQSITPEALEDKDQALRRLSEQSQWLERENLSCGTLDGRIEGLRAAHRSLAGEREQLYERWNREQAMVGEVGTLRRAVEDAEETAAPLQTREHLSALQQQLKTLQAEAPLVHAVVDRQAVAAVVAQWTGIPVGQMMRDEIHTLLELQSRLEQRVQGQSQAMERLARQILSARADLTDPDKPIGVFLLIGPSGTGKTETALTLAEALYGGEQSMTTINMSEFKEPHKVSMLLGSPPGYVGYGEGGVLTEAVRRKPYSVVLLDEMEKAHPGVQDVFYGILDKGTGRDGEGRDIDFRNTVIIMTSNACDEEIKDRISRTPGLAMGDLLEKCQPTLRQHFKPAFIGRTTVIPYYPLVDAALHRIAESRLQRLQQRIQRRFGARLGYDETLPASLAKRSQNHDTGARFLDNIINNELLPRLANLFLSAQANRTPLSEVHVHVEDDGSYALRTTCHGGAGS